MTENTQKVIVWSKKGCHYCQDVKDYLTENYIPYTDIDVTENDNLRDVLDAKYGIRYVPVVEISTGFNDYKAITDIGLEHLAKALKTKEVI